MASPPQVRGALLEEVLLYLLRRAGYRTVEEVGTGDREDPTLKRVGAGLAVLGRGHWHQIDAIADYAVAQPFAHPQRLLLEAKFYEKKVGLDVVRNAVGVMKDVSEYWVTRKGAPGSRPHRRYHYQSALFSASGYSKDAQSYAFAQDIYLMELQDNRAMKPVLDALRDLTETDLEPAADFGALSELRDAFRRRLRGEPVPIPVANPEAIEEVVERGMGLGGALLGMINRQFPVLLVPLRPLDQILRDVGATPFGPTDFRVQIKYDDGGWYLSTGPAVEDRLFAFDLPEALFNMYATEGRLTASSALTMKQEAMGEIQATYAPTDDQLPVTLRFILDMDWMDEILGNTPRRLPPHE